MNNFITMLRMLHGRRRRQSCIVFFLSGAIAASVCFAQGLFDHGTPHIYRNDSLGAVQIPLGGIGAGTIRMNGSATRDNGWWIWGEWGVYPMRTVTNSFFGIRAQTGTSPAVVKVLQTVNQGNWQKMAGLTFRAAYPFGWYDFNDDTAGASISDTFSDNFNDGNLNGWTSVSGTWTNPGTLARGMGTDVWLMRSETGTDFTLEADTRMISGSTIIRFRSSSDGSTGYALAVEPGDIKLYKFPYVSLSQVAMTNAMNTWYHVKIVTSGTNIKVYYNGAATPAIDYNDPDYPTGKYGLGAYGTSEFDNVTASPSGSSTFVELPVKVSLEVFNPLIPLDSKNSAVPCAVYSFTVENTGTQSASVSLLGTQLNCIGTGVLTGYGQNVNSIIRENGSTILHLRSGIAATQRYFGDLALLAYQQSASVTATSSWSTLDALLADFTADGALTGADSTGPTAAGQTVQGALSAASTLVPGEKKTFTFVLTWYFPNRQTNWGPNPAGPQYANWWTSALDVARYMNQNLADLTAKTGLYIQTFYSSNLPYWMLDGAADNTAILRSPTVFWNKDGFIGVNEGWRNDTHQDGNCTHVVQYAQGHAYLFPDIARTIRQGVFAGQYQTSGAIYFRTWETRPACDGQFGEILSVYREYLHSIDGSAWLTQMWPRTKHAMEYAIAAWDGNEDGVLSGSQWNTLDGNINGNNTWIGSIYLGALAASEKMAGIQGDTAFASRCARIRTQGSTGQDTPLFSSLRGYYIQIPDNPGTDAQYGNGCEIDQLLGQYWANIVGVGLLYPKAHIRTALQSLYANNYHANFVGYNLMGWRRFISANDAGLIMCSWPSGTTRPANPIGYYTECMTGFEYAAACAMIQAGLLTEGFTAFKACRDRYNGAARGDWWMTPGGDPFMEIEWGYYYFRALAAWSAIPSCQGYAFDGPGKSIGFHPVFKPAGHTSFFIGSEGYGTFSQARSTANQWDTLALKSGTLTLKQLDVYLDSLIVDKNAEVRRNGALQNVTATFGTTDGNVHIAFVNDVTISAGDNLTVAMGKTVSVISRNHGNAIRNAAISSCRGGILLRLQIPLKTAPIVDLFELSGKRIALSSDSRGGAKQSWIYGMTQKNSRLVKGIYIVKVQTDEAMVTKRLYVK